MTPPADGLSLIANARSFVLCRDGTALPLTRQEAVNLAERLLQRMTPDESLGVLLRFLHVRVKPVVPSMIKPRKP